MTNGVPVPFRYNPATKQKRQHMINSLPANLQYIFQLKRSLFTQKECVWIIHMSKISFIIDEKNMIPGVVETCWREFVV
jgi:hypothetical protein